MTGSSLRLLNRTSSGATWIVLASGVFFTALAVVLVPRGAIEVPGRLAFLLLLGVALAAASFVLVMLASPRTRSDRPRSNAKPMLILVAVGAVLQAVIAFVLSPVQSSDAGAYLALARALANGEPYRDANGFLAFWPPGLPFFLAPFAWTLNSDATLLLAANLFLFGVTCVAVERLGTQIFDARSGLIAATLLTIWPTRLLLSTQASKETLTLALTAVTFALAVHLVPRRPMGANAILAVALGASLGLAALTQPGLVLLAATYPFAFWFAWRTFDLRRLLWLAFLAAVALACVLAPWMLRNHRVFDGAFSGISTNGGSVFYRANNELANGYFVPRGTVDLVDLPELEQNSEGFRLGKAWITSHPLDVPRLAALKLAALLDSDAQGAYWAILRRSGEDDATARLGLGDVHQRVYDASRLASTVFWVLLCAAVARRASVAWFEPAECRERVSALLYPFLYCCVIFAFFESGARQHIFAVAPLLVAAASNRRGPERARLASVAAPRQT